MNVVRKMTLVTCHSNADFDAFSAMLAARRLYDNPILLFPGSQEKGLKKLYAEINKDFFNFIEQDQLSKYKISRLVILDTRQRSRLSHVDSYLAEDCLEIIAWDHHPDTSDDITTTYQIEEKIGAVTSLLVQHLAEQNIALTPYEATLLGVGIYSDTGSFTYSSTTAKDFSAAAWLLGQGMDVNRIGDMADNKLSALHIHILNSLIDSAKSYQISGHTIVISEVSLEHYLGDFANIVQHLMSMENFPVLFAIGFMGDRVQLVARSRDEAINVGDICKTFNGGGHAYAASASIRTQTINEIKDSILYAVHRNLHGGKSAGEYMSSPAIGIETSMTIQKADELMMHFSLKSVPVFRDGTRECIGLLDSETASKASAHGLGEACVADYMQKKFRVLPVNATLNELATVIMDYRQRIVPIVDQGTVCGVVTRTDLIHIFAEDFTPEKRQGELHERNVTKLLKDRFPQYILTLLHIIGSTAEKLALPVYAVGGFVRDLLLDVPNHDIDLVVEGNGLALAKALAAELGGRVNEHRKFLTSVIIFHDIHGKEHRIDVATARLEYYAEPAALPNVEQSSIKMDSSRRDFTINALAIRLDGQHFGLLKDFFDGQRDIRNKRIRVLHTLSFVEDPTRCLRAVRFEQRYQFSLGENTEKLIRNAVSLKLMDKLSPKRIFNEYNHICHESNPHNCFMRLHDLGILQAIAPHVAMTAKKKVLLSKTSELIHWFKLVTEEKLSCHISYFLALAHGMKYREAEQTYAKLGLPQKLKKMVLGQRQQIRFIQNRLKQEENTLRTSQLCDILRPLAIEILVYLMALSDTGTTKKIATFITQWSKAHATIDGYTLQALGLDDGPAFRQILKRVLDAKLDGEAPDAEQQIRLAKQYIALEKSGHLLKDI